MSILIHHYWYIRYLPSWHANKTCSGKFLLMPVDYSLHLRPTLAHLNVGNVSKKCKEEADEDSDDEPTMRRAVEVSVQVQKRETERQQQVNEPYLSSKMTDHEELKNSDCSISLRLD